MGSAEDLTSPHRLTVCNLCSMTRLVLKSRVLYKVLLAFKSPEQLANGNSFTIMISFTAASEKIHKNNIAPLLICRCFTFKQLTVHNMQMHAGAKRKLLYHLCVRTDDNPLAKARGLSSGTYAQTIK